MSGRRNSVVEVSHIVDTGIMDSGPSWNIELVVHQSCSPSDENLMSLGFINEVLRTLGEWVPETVIVTESGEVVTLTVCGLTRRIPWF